MRHMEMFTGRVGKVEDIVEFNGGCVLNFSVAETPRVKKGNEWVDDVTIWTNVAIFGDEARNLHRSIKPGTFVTVIGSRKASEYTVKDTNEKRISQSVIADQVGISITKFNFVESIGNINYAKGGAPSYTKTQAEQTSTPQAITPESPASQNDPFGDDTLDDPFGEDDDPFGLNSL